MKNGGCEARVAFQSSMVCSSRGFDLVRTHRPDPQPRMKSFSLERTGIKAPCLQRSRAIPTTPDNALHLFGVIHVSGKHRMVESSTPFVCRSIVPIPRSPGMRARRGCSSWKLFFQLRVEWFPLRLQFCGEDLRSFRSYRP
jgi:hypothetical protein